MPERLRRALRSLRISEVRILLLALTIAVLAVTSVSFFTDRVERAMRLQGASLLGADLLVKSSRPVREEVRALGTELSEAESVEFHSVAMSGESSLLSEILAVSEGYPLRGALETSTQLATTGTPTAQVPAAGEAWAAAEVYYRLGLQPGATIQLGEASFTLTRVITFEINSGSSVFRLAPRVMINLSSLAQTELITAASRARYALLLAGDTQALDRFKSRLRPRLAAYESLQSVDDGRPEISGALQRAVRFMKLASVLSVILAGAAVALAVRSYARREIRPIAIMKTLGATRRQLWQDYMLRFSLLVAVATLIGSALGFATQFLLTSLLASWFSIELPGPGLQPLFAGFATATLTLTGFALPPVMRLLDTPPIRIIQGATERPPVRMLLNVIAIAMVTAVFLVWLADDIKLAAIVFGGVLGVIFVMQLSTWLITRLFQRLQPRQGRAWQLGLANIGRFGARASLLMSSIGIAILALTLLGSVREGLINAWLERIPDDAPNHFLINIQPADVSPVETFFAQRGLRQHTLYPMIRGRLTSINGRTVTAADFDNHRARETLNRDLNLSMSADLPPANEILAGHWFTAPPAQPGTTSVSGLSVEKEIAGQLGVNVGDRLGFDISGQAFAEKITSLRSVEWDTMQPNFYVIAAPGTLDQFPINYITAVRIDEHDTGFTGDLIKAFPGITVLDVRAIFAQIRRVIDQASNAVKAVFSFSLLAGIVVLLAALQSQRNERRQEIAILKTLGADRQRIRISIITEFIALGAFAGLLGAGFAQLTGWLLARHIFELDYSIAWSALAWGVAAGVLSLAGVGYIVVRSLFTTPPVHLLQEA